MRRLMQDLAQRGATARYAEIQAEMDAIKAFLDQTATDSGAHAVRPKRVFSPATRRKISLALRRSWAQRHAVSTKRMNQLA